MITRRITEQTCFASRRVLSNAPLAALDTIISAIPCMLHRALRHLNRRRSRVDCCCESFRVVPDRVKMRPKTHPFLSWHHLLQGHLCEPMPSKFSFETSLVTSTIILLQQPFRFQSFVDATHKLWNHKSNLPRANLPRANLRRANLP